MKSNSNSKVKPFGAADKIGYMFGDFGNDFTFILSSMFLLKFYTDVMGVSPVLVGMMMMLARIVDAFTDVAMGQICDRSKTTEKGKFAPWVLRMAGPVSIASFLMYAVWFKDMPMSFKVFWMFFTYLLWGSICYTGVNIPYGSMASAISQEPEDRAALSTFRTIGATLAQTVIGVVLPLVVYYKNDEGKTFLSGEAMAIAAFICSIGAFVCYVICYKLVTERVKIEKEVTKFSFKDITDVLHGNRALVGIIVAAILLLLSFLTLSGMGSYLYPNYFENAKAMSVAALMGSVATLVSSPFVMRAGNKYGKKEVAAIGSFLGGIMLLLAFFIHTHDIKVWLTLYLVAFIGLGFFNILCWAMITDVIDDTEVRTGIRSDGTIYAVYSFARKIGQAASSGLIGYLLTLIGYTQETQFDANVVNGIYNIATLVPAIGFILVALSLQFLFPLTKKKVDSNVATLKERRGN